MGAAIVVAGGIAVRAAVGIFFGRPRRRGGGAAVVSFAARGITGGYSYYIFSLYSLIRAIALVNLLIDF